MIQRLALMQRGHYQQTTPQTGLDVALGQIPLDLNLLNKSLASYLRVKGIFQCGWNGKGGRNKDQKGHLFILDDLLCNLQLPDGFLDSVPKTRDWEQNYRTIITSEGENPQTGFRLYTDGSRVNNAAGYRAVLLDMMRRQRGRQMGV